MGYFHNTKALWSARLCSARSLLWFFLTLGLLPVAAQAAPTLSINSVSVVEGNTGTTGALFTVTLSATSGEAITVDFATASSTALAGFDFSATNGTLNFAPGETSQSFFVPVIGDLLDETDETFLVTLSNPVNAELGSASGTGTILDDDAEPQVFINTNVEAVEGDTGYTNVVFTVTLSSASGKSILVDYTTDDGTATAGSDYVGTNGVFSFSPGQVSQSIQVNIAGDIQNEPNEVFYLRLTNAVNGTLANLSGFAVIISDDPVPAISIGNLAVEEGQQSSTNAVFSVALSAVSKGPVTVDFETIDGTALAGSDYIAFSGTLLFEPGVTAQSISVAILGDLLNEPNETFLVHLLNPSNANIQNAYGTCTIVNDDPEPVLSINSVQVPEGNGGAADAVFTVTLTPASGQTVTVNYATVSVTAAPNSDFFPTNGTLTFLPGQTSQQVGVRVIGDGVFESDETFRVDLSGVVNATLGQSQGTGTILNDEPMPVLSISGVTVLEGNSGFIGAVFTVTSSIPSSVTMSASYTTANGTATAGSDYSAVSGNLTFSSGVISRTITVVVNGDVINEADETFSVTLSNPSNAQVGTATAIGTILNDDPLPELSINNVSIVEGNSGTKNATFTVGLSSVSGQTVSVNYATSDGSATSGTDYLATNGVLTIPAGQVSRSISVTVIGDLDVEPDEVLYVNLSDAVNANLVIASGTCTIIKDDVPRISITGVSVSEGNTGAMDTVLTASLSAASSDTISVDFVTGNGSALAGTDYSAAGGTLYFPSGSTSEEIRVPILGDLLDEFDENFAVTLSSPVNATLSASTATVTIVDDDPEPVISISSPSLREGGSGSTNAVFTVSLSALSGKTVTASYVTGGGTATAWADYVPQSGNVTLNAGTLSQNVTVTVYGDTLDEADETFTVTLSNPANATLGTAVGTGTIVDDDPLPVVSVTGVSVTEGNSGTRDAVFSLTLSPVSGRDVSVNVATVNGTALAGSDYVATNGTVTFDAGQTTRSVVVKVNGDSLNEETEVFSLNLSSPLNALVGTGTATGSIVNDDAVPTLSLTGVSLVEGNAGTTNALFAVTLSAVSGLTVTADYTTASGTAASGTDFLATNGTITLPAGSTSATVVVPVKGDTLNEINETFTVALSNLGNANPGAISATGTIVNDDPLPALSISPISLAEGNAGTTNGALFTVTLSPASGQTVTVNYATANGTATSGSDFIGTNGLLTFASGTTSQQIRVGVIGDNVYENHETFQIQLSAANNATLTTSAATATITNDESLPQLTISDESLLEGDTGSTLMVFTVSFTQVSDLTISVQYATASGSASAGADYTTTSGTLTFTPGITSRTVSVAVAGDLLDEANETLTVGLSNPVNAGIADASGTGTIVDNDPIPILTISDVELLEGSAGTTSAVFTLALSEVSGRSVSVNYATANSTATAGSDYIATNGTLTLLEGTATGSIVVRVYGDQLFETNEVFYLNLSVPVNVSLARTQAKASILADETRTLWFTNAAPVEVISSGAATPYPSSIEVSGVPGIVSQVKVALDGLEHTWPDDLDIVLVNAFTNVLLLSDRGGGNAISGVNLLLDDPAANLVPDSAAISSGTYRPSGDGTLDIFPAPVPLPPHGNRLDLFSGQSPNGAWSLYVLDDSSGDSGALRRGWRLSLTTTNLVSPGAPGQADLSVTVSDSPDPAQTEHFLTYQVTVINSGPAAATGVVVSNLLPAGVVFGSASISQGTWSRNSSVVLGDIGSLAVGASATLAVTVTPSTPATISFSSSVSGSQTDPIPANNSAMASTIVNWGPPAISVSDVAMTERNALMSEAAFLVTLSRAWDKTVTVNYATANGTASSGSDYYAVSGTLSFAPGITSLPITVLVVGDSQVEANETFFLDLSAPVNGEIARPRATATIVNDDSVAGSVDRLQWSSISPVQYQFVPITVTLSAVDPSGAVVGSFTAPAAFTGMTGTGSNSVRLLITEIDQNSDGVELANATGLPLDLTGWKVGFYDWLCWPYLCNIFEFPPGTVCPPAGIMTIRDSGTYPGAYPNFFSPENISWFNDPTNNPVAVMILNPSGQMEDFFCSVDAFPGLIVEPMPVPESQWSGAPASPNTISLYTYQRVGSSDQNNASNFQLGTSTMGTLNPGLALPWGGPQAAGDIVPLVTGPFVNGVWTGAITVNQPFTNLYIRADDGDGHLGFSSTFEVRPSTELGTTATAAPASVSVGQDATFTVQVTNRGPAAAQSVSLVSTLPASFAFKSGNSTQGSVSHSGGAVTASIGNMTAGSRVTLTVTATATAPGGATNVATVSTTSVDYQPSNNTARASVWVNYPPTISAIADQVMLEDGLPLTVPFTIQDVETAAGSLTVTATSSNPGLVPNNLVPGGSGSSRTVTLSPVLNQNGTATITVFVADSQDTSTESFVLQVTPVNDPPVLGAQSARTINELTLLTVSNPASDVDTPLAGLTYQLLNPPTGAVISASGVITWTPTELQGPSTNVLTTVVRDNGSPMLSATNAFTVIVNEVNAAPIITMPSTRTVIEGTTLSALATAADADRPTNTLTFQLVSGPAGLTASAGGVISWTPPVGFNPSTNTTTVRVFDNGTPSLSATGSFQVIVNHRPVPASPTLERFAGAAIKVLVSDLLGTDPDGDAVELDSLDSVSAEGFPVSTDGQWVYYTPDQTFTNADSFSYSVMDGRGATQTGTVSILAVGDDTGNPSVGIDNLGNGSFRVRFAGIPGYEYTIQTTPTLEPAQWQSIGTATADSTGAIHFTHSPPSAVSGYYRIIPYQP